MSNEETSNQQGQPGGQDGSGGPDPRYGAWQPTPQSGEYDVDATAFVQLPPEDLANIPLAAPGQGYVPPMIMPLTPAAGLDPAATGSWMVQTQNQQALNQQTQNQQDRTERRARETAAAQETGAVHWPDPNQQAGYAGPHQDTSHATAQWNFTGAVGAAEAGPEAGPEAGYAGYGYADPNGPTAGAGQPGPAEGSVRTDRSSHPDHHGHADETNHAGHGGHTDHGGHTGQWTIPVADGDLPDESGEFLASAHAPQWYADGARPATLPGGAPAPWATPEPVPVPVPEAESPAVTEPLPDHSPEADTEPEAEPATDETAEQQAVQQAEEARTERPAVVPAEATTAAAESAAPTTADTVIDAVAPDLEHPGAPDPEAATEESDPASGDAPETVPDAAPAAAATVPDAPSEHPSTSYLLHVNGVDRPVSDAWIGESLLYVLRERLGLAGAKDGCSQGECGACNVQVDGRLVASCLVPAATAAGSEVRTVEGLAVDGEPSDVQRALSACGAVQCGFCIPGMAMTVHDLLEGNHAPSELETRQALCGNLCRCSGYRGVLDAVAEVVASREASADAAATAARDEARIPQQAEPGAGGVQRPHPHEGEAL